MTWEDIGTYAVAFSLFAGAFFTLVGAIGLIKLNDPMTRVHAPTKVGTMGIGALLLASMIHSFVFGEGSMHELLIMAFLFATAPISANFISKVNIHKKSSDHPPEAPGEQVWSTLTTRDESTPGRHTGETEAR